MQELHFSIQNTLHTHSMSHIKMVTKYYLKTTYYGHIEIIKENASIHTRKEEKSKKIIHLIEHSTAKKNKTHVK